MLGRPRSIVALGVYIGLLALLLAGAGGLALAWKTSDPSGRNWLAAQLADRALIAETSEAEHYCLELGKLGPAGAPQLARLAAESSAALARVARQTINVRMGAALARNVAARGAPMDESDQQEFEALAHALSVQAARTPGSGQRWFETVARQLMLPIEAYDADRAMRILAWCDDALETLHARRQEARSRTVVSLPSHASWPLNVATTACGAARGSSADDGTELLEVPKRDEARRDEARRDVQRSATSSPGDSFVTVDPRASTGSVPPRSDASRGLPPLNAAVPHGTETNGSADEHEPTAAPQAPGARPLSQAATPDKAAPSTMRVVDVPGPDMQRRRVRQYRTMTPAELDAALATADPYETRVIERVRAEKGVRLEALPRTLEGSGPSVTDAELGDRSPAPPSRSVDRPADPPRRPSSVGDQSTRDASNDDRADRLALILGAPSAKFPALRLRQLIEDPDPRVRQEALTALATTNDPRLEEIARRHALRDPDPGVADAAKRILDGIRR